MNPEKVPPLEETLMKIDLYSGFGIDRIELHKYDFNMMYFLLLQTQGNISNESDYIFYSQSNDSARWIGGFIEDNEFSINFNNIPSYVDSIALVAVTQKCNNDPQPILHNVEFSITLLDLAEKEIAQHTTRIESPRLFADIFKIAKKDEVWRITSPGIQLHKNIDDRLCIRHIIDDTKLLSNQ